MVMAVAIQQGIESDLIPKIATGFCSGVAQTGGMCGALSGAIMALSMVHGRGTNGDGREFLYKISQKLVMGFEEKYGSQNCSGLLDLDLGTDEGQAAYKARNLFPTCEGYVREAARLVEELLVE
jgi:C_GCAxxG_C_C family probable redox protein